MKADCQLYVNFKEIQMYAENSYILLVLSRIFHFIPTNSFFISNFIDQFGVLSILNKFQQFLIHFNWNDRKEFFPL